MNHIYLCGHTGSENRACDAILRSTAGVLKAADAEHLSAMTFQPDYDRKMGLNQMLDLIPTILGAVLWMSGCSMIPRCSRISTQSSGNSFPPPSASDSVLQNTSGK